MLGKCDSKYVTDGLCEFKLLRTASGNDISSGWPALGATTQNWSLADMAADGGCYVDLTYSAKGSTNTIFMLVTGNGGTAVGTTLRMCLNGNRAPFQGVLTGAALFAAVTNTASTTIGQLYTFSNLAAARYIITIDSGCTTTTQIWTAMTGPSMDLFRNT